MILVTKSVIIYNVGHLSHKQNRITITMTC